MDIHQLLGDCSGAVENQALSAHPPTDEWRLLGFLTDAALQRLKNHSEGADVHNFNYMNSNKKLKIFRFSEDLSSPEVGNKLYSGAGHDIVFVDHIATQKPHYARLDYFPQRSELKDMSDESTASWESPQIEEEQLSGSSVKAKRKRASTAQLCALRQVYAQTSFPSSDTRRILARRLGMTPRSVQIWFQNQRQIARHSQGRPTQ